MHGGQFPHVGHLQVT